MDVFSVIGLVASVLGIAGTLWAIMRWFRKRRALRIQRAREARLVEKSRQARYVRAWSDRGPLDYAPQKLRHTPGLQAFVMNVQNDSSLPIKGVYFFYHVRTRSKGLRYDEHPASMHLRPGGVYSFTMPPIQDVSPDQFVFDGVQFEDANKRVWVLSSRPVDNLHLYREQEMSEDSIQGRRQLQRAAEARKRKSWWWRAWYRAGPRHTIMPVPSDGRGMPLELRTTT